MMYGEHFSILNTYWKPLQPNYAIFHIISFRKQYSSCDDILTQEWYSSTEGTIFNFQLMVAEEMN